MKILNPTGMPARISDRWGMGSFGAPRGGRKHLGLDLESRVGQLVRTPITGVVEREARPYGDGGIWDYGCWIEGSGEHEGLRVVMFYVRIPKGIIGKWVMAGDVIGTACDLTAKYDEITNHIHLAVQQHGEFVDPTAMVFGVEKPLPPTA